MLWLTPLAISAAGLIVFLAGGELLVRWLRNHRPEEPGSGRFGAMIMGGLALAVVGAVVTLVVLCVWLVARFA